ncbi:leucine-rich repeat protein [bacterium]|nr:leucine-rich repeat protein [bacterium]
MGKNCFEGCVNLTHEIDDDVLVINKGLAIDECAFSGCNSIKAVSLMANSTIGNSAFTNCVNIEKLFISKDVNKYN